MKGQIDYAASKVAHEVVPPLAKHLSGLVKAIVKASRR